MGGGGGVVNVKVVLCALALRNLAHSPSNNPDDRHGYWGYSQTTLMTDTAIGATVKQP